MRFAWLSAVVAVAGCIAGCGGTSTAPPEPPDPALATGHKLARFAFETNNYEDAITLYERALARAYARDDVQAIGEIGTESALALLRAGRASEAATRAQRIREELTRREVQPSPRLVLTEATARYAAGESAVAETLAAPLLTTSGSDPQVAARATYLLGMIAADRGDGAGVDAALSVMDDESTPALQADRRELTGRRQMLQSDPAAALVSFEDAVALRRESRDDTGVARALAFAGAAAQQSGRPDMAAHFYLRAGRSAAAVDRRDKALGWYRKAEALALQSARADISDAARQELEALEGGRDRS